MSYSLFFGSLLLGGIAFHLIATGLLKNGFRTWISIPFATLLGCFLLYIFDFLRMPEDARDLFIAKTDYANLILFSGLFVALIFVGHLVGTRFAIRKLQRSNQTEKRSRFRRQEYLILGTALFLLGALAMIMFIASSGGFVVKYSGVHGSNSNFSTAYLYRLPISIFTGCFLLIMVRLKFKRLPTILLCMVAIGLAFLLFDAFTQGKRGDLIRYALLLVIPFFMFGYLQRAKQLPVILAVSGLALFLNYAPYLRQATSLGSISSFDQVLSELPELTDKSREARIRITQEGKHVVFASNALAGALDRGEHNYGMRWAFPFMNLIPRSVWPEKPSRYDVGNTTYDMLESGSPFNIPSGSHTGGMVESFIEWGYLIFPIWFSLGVIGGYLFQTTLLTRDIHSSVLLFGFYNFYMHFLLQDTVAGILFLMFSLGPYFATVMLVRVLTPKRRTHAVRV